MVDQWVAVAYDDTFYIVKITALSSEDRVNINLISKVKPGAYKWPKPKDTASVDGKYIFCSSPSVHKNSGTIFFAVKIEDFVRKQYNSYKTKYVI